MRFIYDFIDLLKQKQISNTKKIIFLSNFSRFVAVARTVRLPLLSIFIADLISIFLFHSNVKQRTKNESELSNEPFELTSINAGRGNAFEIMCKKCVGDAIGLGDEWKCFLCIDCKHHTRMHAELFYFRVLD